MKYLIFLLLLMVGSSLAGQKLLTIESQVYTNTEVNWMGVNIPRSENTNLTFRNNSIASTNGYGYLLQAGDEGPIPNNNNLDGAVITGNKLSWNGQDAQNVITHGLFNGYNVNGLIKYNYLENVPYGIILKSGTDNGVNMTFTSGGVAYNIVKNGKFALRLKGINGVNVYNNTFYSGDGKGWYLMLITSNGDRAIPSPSTGTKIYNNIFYSTRMIPMIKIESGCLTDFECDYNVYWCTVGQPVFSIDGKTYTWAQWRALGYDANSVVIDPRFRDFVNFVPEKVNFGLKLNPEWSTGLSMNAMWAPGSSPATINQPEHWQIGAVVREPNSSHIYLDSTDLHIYPNPACNLINIVVMLPELEDKHFRIYDYAGRLRHDIHLESGKRIFEIPINLSPGFYIAQVFHKDHFLSKKLIVTNCDY